MNNQSRIAGCSKSFALRRKRGAITLFLCFLLGSTSTILLVCLQASILRRDEAALIRAGRMAAESCLAAYDVELLQDYGIWAVERSKISNIVCEELLNNRIKMAEVSIDAADNALDTALLSEQIAAYMKVRAPAIWINKLSDALQTIRAPSPDAGKNLIPASGRSLNLINRNREVSGGLPSSNFFVAPLEPGLDKLQDIDMDDVMDFQMKLQEYMFKCIPYNLAVSAVNSCLDWIFSPITEPLKDAVAKRISKTIDNMIKDRLPVNSSDFGVVDNNSGEYLPDYFDPDALSELSGLADRLLSAPTQADSIVLTEYCLAVFPSQVVETIDRNTGKASKIKTPDGRAHDSLKKHSVLTTAAEAGIRENELEMIITGLDSPQKAADRMNGNLMMVRSIIRIIEVVSDQEKLNSFRPAANIMSALITTASAGSVNIDSETAVWMIAVSEAVRSAYEDTKQLISGKSIALWTFNKQSYIYFSYHDYMRLFLLISPEEKILTNISRTIQLNLPGEYVSSIKTSIIYGKSICSFISSFRVNQSNGIIDHDETR